MVPFGNKQKVLAKYVNSSSGLYPVCIACFHPLYLGFSLQILLDGVKIKVLEAFCTFATFFEIISEMCLHNNVLTALLETQPSETLTVP